jgi:hypothetical protein
MNYGPLSLYCFACHFEYQIHKPAAVLLLVTYESKAIKKSVNVLHKKIVCTVFGRTAGSPC